MNMLRPIVFLLFFLISFAGHAQSNFRIGAQLSPTLTYPSFQPNDQFDQSVFQLRSGRGGMKLGLRGTFVKNERLDIQTGFFFVSKKFLIDQTAFPGNPQIEGNILSTAKFSSREIPLLAIYKLRPLNNQVDLKAIAGIGFEFTTYYFDNNEVNLQSNTNGNFTFELTRSLDQGTKSTNSFIIGLWLEWRPHKFKRMDIGFTYHNALGTVEQINIKNAINGVEYIADVNPELNYLSIDLIIHLREGVFQPEEEAL